MNKTAVIGFGAVGASFGFLLQKSFGTDFAVITDDRHAGHLRKGVLVNGTLITPHIVTAGSEPPFVPDVLLICVKNYGLAAVFEQIRKSVDKHTVILPILNGISAVDILRSEFPGTKTRGFALIWQCAFRRFRCFSEGRIIFAEMITTNHPAVLL